VCVCEIEALHCLVMMALLGCVVLAIAVTFCSTPTRLVGFWPIAVVVAVDWPHLQLRLLAMLHVFLLCFYASLVLFPLCVLCVLLVVPSLQLLLLLFLMPPGLLLACYPLLLRFYCMFYGNFQTLDALCSSNAFNAFHTEAQTDECPL